MKRMTFGRPSLRSVVKTNVASLRAMGGGAELPPELAASLAKLPLPRERVMHKAIVRTDATDMDAVYKNRGETLERPLEATVIRAVEELLAVHPKVIWALRVNAGAASYQAKSGKYAPVYFHRWVRAPERCRMSDFFAATIGPEGPRIAAIECKRPGWHHPTDQREREQAAFLALVRKHGGIGIFATSAQDVATALG